MSEDQIEVIAKRAATRALEEFHRECPSFKDDDRKKIHILCENSTNDSIHTLASFGKRLNEASVRAVQATLWALFIAALFALTFPFFKNWGVGR